MPTFSNVRVYIKKEDGHSEEASAEVDFEVYCANCGAGLCRSSSTRASRIRAMPQVVVEPCENCLAQAAQEREDQVRSKLDSEIAELRKELNAGAT